MITFSPSTVSPHIYYHHNCCLYLNSGRDIEEAFSKITYELQERYPGHILPKEYQQWVMFKYSGMTLSMNLIHASATEYVTFIGSALDTDGYLGTVKNHLLFKSNVARDSQGSSSTLLLIERFTKDNVTLKTA